VRHNPASNVIFISWDVDGSDWQWKGTLRPQQYGTKLMTFLIVDEAQGSYSDHNFWEFIKSIHPFSYYRVILFCSYGSPSTNFSDIKTPMFIAEHQRISLQPVHHDWFMPVGLLLQQNEYDDLVERWSLTSKLGGPLRQTIFKVGL